MSTLKTLPLQANLRATPKMDPKNILAILPQGQLVTMLETNGNWLKIKAQLQDSVVEGFMYHNLLVKATAKDLNEVKLSVIPNLPEVHLPKSATAVRTGTAGRAYPLSEENMPGRVQVLPKQRAEDLVAIVKWLKVNSSPRYATASNQTYCNIYACDYCYLAGAYLPRVWWMQKALAQIIKGEKVSVQYAKTVTELNANSLYNWLEEFSKDFGWRRTFNLTELQEAANNGQVCLISAQRNNLNSSGHISLVVPENGTNKAKRKGLEVTVALQSQAGSTNFQFGGKAWWHDTKFRAFGFWTHA